MKENHMKEETGLSALRSWAAGQRKEFRLLLRSVPPLVLLAFALAVFLMNLLANKSIAMPVSWLALDGGLLVSWLVFLLLDMITRHFGAKAATQLSLFAMAVNLCLCGVLFLVSRIPGSWSAAAPGSEVVINAALDSTFGGTWYVILGSAAAFLLSSAVNNTLNEQIGRIFKKNPHGRAAYFCRSYVSTAVGQFTDNMTFALLVSRVFFGWTWVQCLTCSLMGMGVELLCEVAASFFGYGICEKWRLNRVGEEYRNLKGLTA